MLWGTSYVFINAGQYFFFVSQNPKSGVLKDFQAAEGLNSKRNYIFQWEFVIDFFFVFWLVLEKCFSRIDIWYYVNKTRLEFYSSNFTHIDLSKDVCVFFLQFWFPTQFLGQFSIISHAYSNRQSGNQQIKYSKQVQKMCHSVFLSDIDSVMCATQNSLRGRGRGAWLV